MEKHKQDSSSKLDPKELHLPETVFSRDIENRVFQGIIVKVLSEISGIGLVEGNFLDTIMGRLDKVKGISTEQDAKNHALKIRIELNVAYGILLPQKAEEVQSKVITAITSLTGVRVSDIHIVFKELISKEQSVDEKKESAARKKTKLVEDFRSHPDEEFEKNIF